MSPRWQHRSLLNSPPSMDEPSIQLHTNQFPTEKSRNYLSGSYTSGNWENTSGTVPYSWKGAPTPRFPLGSKEFVPHSSLITFKSATKGLDPKSPSSESQQFASQGKLTSILLHFLKFYLHIYFCLYWICLALCEFSLVAETGVTLEW